MNNNKGKKLLTAGKEDVLTKRRQNMNTNKWWWHWKKQHVWSADKTIQPAYMHLKSYSFFYI